jgi:hypothetical protein
VSSSVWERSHPIGVAIGQTLWPRTRYLGVVYLSGWRLALAVVIGVLFLALVLSAVLWLAALLALVIGVAWLNLVLLPRVARRLRVPRWVLDIACLVLLGGVGWLLGAESGLAAGAVGWLVAIGLPRVLSRRYRDRLRTRTWPAASRDDALSFEPRANSQQADVWKWDRRP